MECQPLSVIEANSERPLLPVQLIPVNLERRTLGLNNMIWLRRCSRAGPQVWVIFAGGCWMNLFAIKGTRLVVDMLGRGGGETIYFGDLQIFRDFCTNVERVCIVIRVLVL